jgi:hypothetical protein
VPEPNRDLPLDCCLGEPLLDHLMAGRIGAGMNITQIDEIRL